MIRNLLIKNLIRNESGAEIRIDAEIVSNDWKPVYDWFGWPAICPGDVNDVLDMMGGAPIVVRIDSPGGDYVAASQIYTELRDYAGAVTVKIEGMAASAASVIAMGADPGKLFMSPTALMMIHNASTRSEGDYRVMQHSAEILQTVNKACASAYKARTGLDDKTIKDIMDHESWYDAQEALGMKLIDEIMFADDEPQPGPQLLNTLKTRMRAAYSAMAPRVLPQELIDKLDNKDGTTAAQAAEEMPPEGEPPAGGTEEEPPAGGGSEPDTEGLQDYAYMAEFYSIKESMK